MSLQLSHAASAPAHSTQVFILPAKTTTLPSAAAGDLPEAARRYVETAFAQDQKLVPLNHFSHHHFFVMIDEKPTPERTAETLRRSGHQLHALLKAEKVTTVFVHNLSENPSAALALAEGIAMTAYQFEGYKTDEKSRAAAPLTAVTLVGDAATETAVAELQGLLQGVFLARNLVNAPLNKLNAEQLAAQIADAGEEAGYTTEILEEARIQALRMGGLLAVNLGSPEPPTFSILEHKPENARNAKPYVLVGKGVVFDTGGLSLKPTPDSMDYMKADMSGAAAVVGTFEAVARLGLPVYLVGLIPATDNRPGENAYVPGDVIRMHNGLTVEVLNTDAEGRLILADALSYAKTYNPELVIDIATLTGAQVVALGSEVGAVMTNDRGASTERLDAFERAGERSGDWVARLPMHAHYARQLESSVADMKNIGGREAGSITAGKFLEAFTDYPWVHLDIAGPAFLHKAKPYRPVGGTGFGVRLLVEFLREYSAPKKVKK